MENREKPNPYEAQTSDPSPADSQAEPESDMIELSELETATKMIREGKTPGMVKMYLRKQGLDEAKCGEIVKNAQQHSRFQVKAKGLLMLMGGAAMILLGFASIWIRAVIESTGRSPSFVFMALGAGILVKGLLNMMSGVEGSKD